MHLILTFRLDTRESKRQYPRKESLRPLCSSPLRLPQVDATSQLPVALVWLARAGTYGPNIGVYIPIKPHLGAASALGPDFHVNASTGHQCTELPAFDLHRHSLYPRLCTHYLLLPISSLLNRPFLLATLGHFLCRFWHCIILSTRLRWNPPPSLPAGPLTSSTAFTLSRIWHGWVDTLVGGYALAWELCLVFMMQAVWIMTGEAAREEGGGVQRR
jgi:hypothetical protein